MNVKIGVLKNYWKLNLRPKNSMKNCGVELFGSWIFKN